MLKRKLAGIILATTVVNLLNAPITVLAEEIKSKEIITESKEGEEESEITTAKIKKFSLFGSENLSKYDEMFKVDNSNIKAITNNGGNYGQSYINKAIDGNFNTFWETGRANASNFTNEVIIELNDITALNRIVYAARQDGAKGKGFAQEVEIYASTTSSDDDFKLVSSGSYLGSTGDIIEIKFNTTEFKRIKFKFVKANQGWASASEFILYKEDKIADSMENLFVDDSLSKVSEEFNTLEKIEELEEKAKNHPLYKEYKESLENAKALVMDKGDIESEEAEVSKFNTYYTEYRDAYSKEFKMPNSNIKSITNNGGNYGSSSIKYAIDENIDTHWETGNPNSNNFKNEVIINLHDSVVLDRIIYKARNGGKGFAKSFEIYASTTTTGDTFKKVANGSHNVTNDLIQIKFKPTEFRRVKFVFTEANENWASASEFMLYKEDKIDEEVNRIFVDNTMSSVIEEFNNIDKLNDLDNRAKSHPLYNEYKERLNLAKEIVSNPNKLSNTVWKLESRGNSIKESQKRKVWNFQDWQPTGYRVKSGDVINVYVDVENGKPTPEIVFKQMDSQHNGQVHIKLSNGKNTITIPELSSDELRPGTSKAGVLYTSNPYTPEEQGRMPKIRIEGAERYPHYIKGIDNDNDVIRELEEYVQLLSEDASLPDVFDVFSEKTLVNVKATYALDWYKNNNKLPSYTANKSDEVIKETMRFWGFDESSEINSDFNFRYISMVKWLDNGGFMNAGNGITGVNKNEQGALLGVNTGWGLMHEMGHNFDTNNRTIGEVTNNILPLHFQKINGEASKITAQNLWEKNILPKVALDDYSQNEYYPESDKSLLSHIAPLWQLQLYNEEFWPEFERKFRASSFKGGSWELIHDEWVKVASDVLELDLYEHFARHGLRASEDVKKYTSKYSKPTKKLWYINDKIYLDNGGAFTEKVNYSISSIKSEDDKVKLQIEMDEENIKNTLGFEIFRDGETIGFTSGNTFVDNGAIEGKNHEYKVIAYDKEINPNSEATAKLHDLRISVDENITVELNSIFNPINYVSALNYKNEDIARDVKVIKNTVDTGSKGFYEVVYEITSEGTTKTKISEVEVVSKANYLSDIKEVSATTGWRTLQKDKAPDGSPIKLYRDSIESAYVKGLGAHANSSIVYSIEGQGYTKFKSYVGIQAGAGANASATFEVYLDGEKVYDSGLIKDGDNYKYVDINVSGAKELRLVTTDSGNGNAADHTIWAEAKLTTNNTKPTIIAEDKVYKIGDEINILDSINAYDVEDGDLTSKIKIKSSNYEEGKLGNFKVTYEVSDSDNNLIEKTINITVYDILDVKKSYYGKFDNLNK
ncbi:NPCBM/NEW2 domain-containing protein, partial [Clostridium sp.]|uniref:NPCBM/NEW2 domain-containing protein n=1 Tax=Clostridium sp. TaxID=1506 RepID=UPI003F30C159